MSTPEAFETGRVQCLSAQGFHTMSFTQWGAPNATRAVVCVHGLTRSGRDFDYLAGVLAAAGYRVICPDVVGRGQSGWLSEPASYGFPQYLADMTVLLGRLDVEQVDWIGTSMGGLIGMMLAAQEGTPVQQLVLNDVGPLLPKAALERIATYVGQDRRFADLAAAETYLRDVHSGFGDLSDADWRHLTETSTVPTGAGDELRLHYDPAIAAGFEDRPIEDVNLWPLWDRVECRSLVLRGADSDLLLAETATEMSQRGPGATIEEIAACGHAPALMSDGQASLVRTWLLD